MGKRTIIKIDGKEYNVLSEEDGWILAKRENRDFVLSKKDGMTVVFNGFIITYENKIILSKIGERVPITVARLKEKNLPNKIVNIMRNKINTED